MHRFLIILTRRSPRFLILMGMLHGSCKVKPPEIEWQKTFGGTHRDVAMSVHQTRDSGYIISGMTASDDGDISFNHGFTDSWLIKLDKMGKMKWEKTYGGSYWEDNTGMALTIDGGYILIGSTYSFDDQVKGFHGWADIWVVKTDSLGMLQWQKCLGGKYFETGWTVLSLEDDGYLIQGNATSDDGDLKLVRKPGKSPSILSGSAPVETSDTFEYLDVWFIELDSSGNINRQWLIGGNGFDNGGSILSGSNGALITGISTASTEGDISAKFGKTDICIIKFDRERQIVWKKTLGNAGTDPAGPMIGTRDGGLILCGVSYKDDKDATSLEYTNHCDLWVCKLDSLGSMQWNKYYGGNLSEVAAQIIETADGEYLIGGYTNSVKGNVKSIHGLQDGWLIKLDKEGNVKWQKIIGGTGDDVITSVNQASDGGYIVAGITTSKDGDLANNKGKQDAWVIKIKPEQ